MKKMMLVLGAVVCLCMPAAANENGNPLAGPGRGLAELLRILIVTRSPKYRGIGRTDPLAGSRYVVYAAEMRAV